MSEILNNKILSEEERLHVASMFISGVSKEEIYAQFSGCRKELEVIFSDLSIAEFGLESPEESVLKSTLEHFEPSVTLRADPRYSDRQVSFIKEIIENMFNWKLGLSLAAIVLLVGGGYLIKGGSSDDSGELAMKEATGEPTSMSMKVSSSADGQSVSDEIDALLIQANEEMAISDEWSQDTALVTSDKEAMSDYTTTYNVNEI